MFSTYLLFALLSLSLNTASAATATIACNNSPSLCNRSYGNITQLGAHDSAFVRDASTGYSIAGDQFTSTIAQLNAGVRLLTAQVHSATANGTQEWHLCHSYCFLLDAGRLQDWLRNISTWMDAHTHDVVTVLLVNSDSATPADLDSEFVASGIKKYVYLPPSSSDGAAIPAASWPTLQALIAANTRLVTFVASLATSTGNAAAPYLLDEFTYVFENAYDNDSPATFSCAPDRPTAIKGNAQAALSSQRLFLMNHFLYTRLSATIELPDVSAVNATNAEAGVGSLGGAAEQCAGVYGSAPWGLLVDFASNGGAVADVDLLNGVVDAVGRVGVGTGAGAVAVSSTSANVVGTSTTATRAASSSTVHGVSSTTGVAAASMTMVGGAESASMSAEAGAPASTTAASTGCAGVLETSMRWMVPVMLFGLLVT